VYLTQSQLLPYQGTAELFQKLAGIALSPGTLQRDITVAATHLEAPVAAIPLRIPPAEPVGYIYRLCPTRCWELPLSRHRED